MGPAKLLGAALVIAGLVLVRRTPRPAASGARDSEARAA
jgi:hypothetical protein